MAVGADVVPGAQELFGDWDPNGPMIGAMHVDALYGALFEWYNGVTPDQLARLGEQAYARYRHVFNWAVELRSR